LAAIACQGVSGPDPSPERVPRIAGQVDNPFQVGDRGIAPATHLGPSKLEIVPSVFPDGFGNVVPFGNNVLFGFSGFIYRNVPAFSLEVGDVIAFDLRGANSVAVRRTIFFATANKNPDPCVFDPFTANAGFQGIAASSGWTQVVSETQVPANSFGDDVLGNFELRYAAQAPFAFPGGGLLVGFQGSPPATFSDDTPDGIVAGARCTDPSGQLHARFLGFPDQTTGALDDLVEGISSNGVQIGGIVIFPEGGGSTTCGEGVSEARSRIAQLLPDRPFYRFVLNLLLSRMQQPEFPNAETNFGRLLDFLVQIQLVSAQDAADLKVLVAPC
jgi:hypothetical protein